MAQFLLFGPRPGSLRRCHALPPRPSPPRPASARRRSGRRGRRAPPGAPRPSLRPRRPHRQHDVTHVGRRVVDADPNPVGTFVPNSASTARGSRTVARAVRAALVPLRRDAEQHARIARAERAHDDVVASGVFSTTMSRSGPTSRPSSPAAAEPSASARALNAGSTQARATIFAPRSGLRLAIVSTCRSTSPAATMPFQDQQLLDRGLQAPVVAAAESPPPRSAGLFIARPPASADRSRSPRRRRGARDSPARARPT